MEFEQQRSAIAKQAAAMVVVMVTLVSSKLNRRREDDEPICYGPRLEADEHREKNLSLIYNSTDAECIAMLRMSRAPFFHSAICLGRGAWFWTPLMLLWRNKLPCSFMWLGIIKGLELCTRALGDP